MSAGLAFWLAAELEFKHRLEQRPQSSQIDVPVFHGTVSDPRVGIENAAVVGRFVTDVRKDQIAANLTYISQPRTGTI
jgi:hypothetical protein